APDTAGNEYGIQIVGQDAFPREDVARWFELVRAAVDAGPAAKALYVPTFEQFEMADRERDWLAERGIEVGAADRWLTQDARYSEGWAIGRLSFIPGGQIGAAYADGRLLPTDILLTDVVPAEVPYVQGIITLSPATPNSHVAILARGFGVPFVWFADPAARSNLVTLNGREVALRTGEYGVDLRVLDITGQLTPELRAAVQALKRPSPLKYTPKESLGRYSTNVHNLAPADARFVGGKAANYGLLLRTIPANAEPAIALTFDLWDDFLDQEIPGGSTLRETIQERLGDYSDPPNIAALRVDLAAVRDLITRAATFSAPLREAVLAALTDAGFDDTEKIRFRSSTNVEDSDEFTGAGLYDSYSGCLADDLDSDTAGPSHCDPAENNERGVFRAIQRVYASFYNENAFLERLRRSVRESEVGMAVLVHHSFPDTDELANGVATLNYEKSFGTVVVNGEFVTQLGAESVSNPDSTARPEVIRFYQSDNFTDLTRTQSSSLVPLGGYVMPWEANYRTFLSLFRQVAMRYAQMFPAKTTFTLDFEYKRTRPSSLIVKQVRPLPIPKPTAAVATILLNEPVTWAVAEGEFGEPMAKHRAKSTLRLESDVRRLGAAGLATSFLRAGDFQFLAGTERVVLTNGSAGWPNATFTVENGTTAVDRWTWGSGAERRAFTLRTSVIRDAAPPRAPWVTQRDFSHQLNVAYVTSQPTLGWETPGFTKLDEVFLVPRQVINERSLLQARSAKNASGSLQCVTSFYWPEPPTGPSAGYTAPNIGFVESTLHGLTPNPIVLQDPLAQTYSPGHHNFTETFVFEPRLDSSVPAGQLAALEDAGIRQLIVILGFDGNPRFAAFNAAGQYRELK
ncbi:MAG TPA: hypothetical protein DCE44_05455, partial [Verrucomicrobiales bacterium]|nr:hypothetical protein [Verrucomicrobiales bacterium]